MDTLIPLGVVSNRSGLSYTGYPFARSIRRAFLSDRHDKATTRFGIATGTGGHSMRGVIERGCYFAIWTATVKVMHRLAVQKPA